MFTTPFISPPILHHLLYQSPLGQASDEAAGVDTQGAVASDLHTGGSGNRVVSHWTAAGFRSHLSD